MGPRFVLLAQLLLAFAASAAGALPFAGTLHLELGTGFTISGTGQGVSTPARAGIASGGFATTLTQLPPSEFVPITRIVLGSPAGLTAASWGLGRGPGGGFGGDAPLLGTARIGLLGVFTLPVPLAVVGSEGATRTVSGPAITVALRGGGWTTGRVSYFNPDFATSPLRVRTGGDLRTPDGAGRLSLVSATVVSFGVGSGFEDALFARLDLDYRAEPAAGIPEPGALPLFGLGALAVRAGSARR